MSRAAGRGRRPVVRWAARLVRREWRQQLAVLALLTITVAAAMVGGAAAVNAVPDATGRFGAGRERIIVEVDDGAPAEGDEAVDIAATIAAARARFGEVDVVAHGRLDRPTSLTPFDVRDQDPDGVFSAPMLAVRAGRYPTASGEVVLTRGVADDLGATLGSTLLVGGTSRLVVGIVENPAALSDEFALVAPGTLATATSYTLFIGADARIAQNPAAGPDASSIRFRREGVGEGERRAVELAVLTATGLALALVGLIAAAGFVVVAHRRQRQLGLLSAIGADDRHLRLVMVANGAIVGAVASLGGTALGLAGWLVAHGAAERAGDHRVGRFAVPWGLVMAIVVLAIVVAMLAAWWPARNAARLSTMSALSGRPARPRPVWRSLVGSVVCMGLGAGGIVSAQARTDHVRPNRMLVGLLALIAGVVLATPAVIRLLGVVARRLPLAPRLALRDLARHQARAGAALAAIVLGLGISTSIVGIAGANAPSAGEGNLSDRQLLLQIGDPSTAPDPNVTAEARRALDAAADNVVATLGDGVRSVPLDVAYGDDDANARGDRNSVSIGRKGTDGRSIVFIGQPYVATPEVLAFYGIDASSIDPNAELLAAIAGSYIVLDTSGRPSDLATASVAAQVVDLPKYSSAPRFLVPDAAMARRGLRSARSGWLVESSSPFTSAQLAAARDAAERAGFVLEARTSSDVSKNLRTGATAAGAAVALAIILMAVGLLRSESAAEMLTLSATGASPATRRSVSAVTALALAVLGVVLGLGGGYAALVSAYHAKLGDLRPIPVGNLAVLAIGLPAVAASVGWLSAGREPRSFTRHPLE